jgi:type II secretory pathway pseudopilin PulG
MSARKKPGNFVQRLHRKIRQFFNAVTKAFVNWILRSLLLLQRPSRLSQAGFVLPTVVMVLLVVMLLTTAILIRSFDRTKNASNYRVNEVVLKAAAPAIDRARAKIERLFSTEETELEGNTPGEDNIAQVLGSTEYTLGDETQLKLVADFNGTGGVQNEEKLTAAWKFPSDTDNNGKFDSYTLYGIYFRNPPEPGGTPSRKRGSLEARALPQDDGQVQGCGNGASATDAPGWYQVGGQLKKAFFTYVATVPIAQLGSLPPAQYEVPKGNKGFSALEMQLDQARIALDNNAVFYEDDLVLANVPTFRLNGRVHTNSNLLVVNPPGSGEHIKFLQVSSRASCYYNPENAKIVVGGNVAAGRIGEADSGNDLVSVDLYQGKTVNVDTEVVNDQDKTTTKTPAEVAGNSGAYEQRLDVLVNGALNLHDSNNFAGVPVNDSRPRPTLASVTNPANRYPQELVKNFRDKFNPNNRREARSILKQAITTYFAERIRRVSFAEVPITDPDKALEKPGAVGTTLSGDINAVAPKEFVFSGGGEISAPTEWMLIQDPASGDVARYTNLPLNFNGGGMTMPATDPTEVGTSKIEHNLGDRIQVGNNLPTRWLKTPAGGTAAEYAKEKEKQDVKNGTGAVSWNNPDGSVKAGAQRKRQGLVEQLDDLGNTSRNGYWETAAATKEIKPPLTRGGPLQTEELAGGLRVVTGAGIYIDDVLPAYGGTGKRAAALPLPRNPNRIPQSFLPPPPDLVPANLPPSVRAKLPARPIVVWPDTMPMYQWLPGERATGDFNRNNRRNPGEGIKGDLQMRATVVYHYKNSDPDQPIACISSYYDPTDAFTADAPDASGTPQVNRISNNGKIYQPQPRPTAVTLAMQRQARMVFPDGRLANEPLKNAVTNLGRGGALSYADKAALDAYACALHILKNPTATTSGFPEGAIVERAFLDARQVKALHKPETYEDTSTGTPTTVAAPDTLLRDLGYPEKLKTLELGSLTSNYTLPIEQRQPSEVRVTEINLELLRTVPIGPGGGAGVNNTQEYLLPNSGIIYATRDDALPDISNENGERSSATDFQLDPTRHPNGIRLVNGENLERVRLNRTAEKGLILASNLPVYIKGDFNLHRASGGGGVTLEEFQTPVTFGGGADPGNFYTRTGLDKRFACRQNAPDCAGNGDQWRAARILSDAVTLLSDNFRDGFRNEGDYDLRNNAGNAVVEANLKNGFWWNSFATSANWYQPTGANAGFPRDDFEVAPGNQSGSSYVMNGVTPIQRRVRFTEYKMEICRKLPVSECTPSDWVADVDAGQNSGTTAQLARRPIDQRYPRRVAFKRDASHQLILDDSPNRFAIPQIPGNTPTAPPDDLPYGTAPPPRVALADNALWFATSSRPNQPYDPSAAGLNNPLASIKTDYPNSTRNAPLYYLPPEPETPLVAAPPTRPTVEPVHERQLLLPGTPEFPPELQIPTPIAALSGQTALNGQTANDPSDYSVCIGSAQSKLYKVSTLSGGACPVLDKIRQMRLALATLPAVPTAPIPGVIPTSTVTALDVTDPTNVLATATAKVNVFTLPTNGRLGTSTVPMTINFDRSQLPGHINPIFVLRASGTLPIRFTNVTLNLNGVPPNNIFWVSNLGMQLLDGNVNLAGNFLGGAGRLQINDGSQILGGRFLGFGGARGAGSSLTGEITAITTTDEPLLLPILQLHSPEGSPGSAFGSEPIERRWLPRATPTTFNAVFIMGDSPQRPLPGVARNPAEYGGGLGNFPRFLEVWQQQGSNTPIPNSISGGFIQFKKSVFASAPFESIDDPGRDTSLFFDGATPLYMASFSNNDYRYKGGASAQKAPYYMPPERRWGYDVGLLKQTPDLFSRRFVSPTAGTPNEFYREVARDDKWIQTLLCAAQESGSSYTYALPPSQRPVNACQPEAAYN